MLKAIVTILDENDRVIQANRLIDETNSVPVGLGIEHEFHFKVVTADEDLIHKFYKEIDKECNDGFTLR